MKIVYLLTTPDSGAGTEKSVFTQASLMANHHKVEIVGVYRTLNTTHFDVDPRVRIRYLVDARAGRPGLPSRLVPIEWDDQFTDVSDLALEKYLSRTRVDVVVTTTPALASLAAEFTQSRVAIVHQEHRSPMSRGSLLTPLVAAAGRLDLISNLTERSHNWLARRLGPSAPAMVVIPNPYEPGFMPRSSLSNRVIIGSGRLAGGKNFPELVKAFAVANEFVPGWRLRIYGDGPTRTRVQGTVRNYDLIGSVDIVPGTRRMAAEFSKGSIFGMTTLIEGQSLVAIEAAVAGLPMVAYDIEVGPAEIVGQAGGGILVPSRSYLALGGAMAHLMESPQRLREYSERALAGAAAYAPERIEEIWLKTFDALGGGSGKALLSRPASLPVSETSAATDSSGELEQSHELEKAAAWRVALPRPGELDSMFAAVTGELNSRSLAFARLELHDGPPAIVLGAESRGEVLGVLHQIASKHGWYMKAYRGPHEISLKPWQNPSDAPAAVQYATRIAMGARQRITGADSSITCMQLELWEAGSDLVRRAPRGNCNADWVAEEEWQKWLQSGSRTVSGFPIWERVDFPIDVVFTWVDGLDPAWLQKKLDFDPTVNDPSAQLAAESISDARFRNRNEILFSVGAVKRFMPWVRNIYIVTDQQVPTQVVEAYPDVRVVDHRDIFPDPSVLPVFNSHAIESCLHRIEGLSDHFIYVNDDTMVVRPLKPEHFFNANGVAKFFPSSVKVNHGGLSEYPHLMAAANNREIIQEQFGVEITRSMLHTPHPHRKDVIFEMESRYPEDFSRTRASRFRSSGDISVLSSLAQYYGYCSERYASGSLQYGYISLRGAGLTGRLMDALANQRLAVLTLGEPQAHHWRSPQEFDLTRRFLELLVGGPEEQSDA